MTEVGKEGFIKRGNEITPYIIFIQGRNFSKFLDAVFRLGLGLFAGAVSYVGNDSITGYNIVNDSINRIAV